MAIHESTGKFSSCLLRPLEIGNVIVIGGKVKDSADRFDINLASTLSEHDGIPLHMSVRFAENMVVRNTLTRGIGWGHEEREENRWSGSPPNPFVPGAKFKLAIYVRPDGFHVEVNGQHYCVYRHRLGVHEVKAIWVTKGIKQIDQFDVKMC